MKILLTTDTVGGVWNFSLSLARELRCEVHIATMGRKLSAAQQLEIADFPFYESEFPLEWTPDPWPGLDRAGEWLLSLEREIRPEVLHHNTVSLAQLPFQAPSLVTVHSCVLSWWQAVKGEAAPPEWDEYRRRVRRSLQAAAEVVAPSNAMLTAARNLYELGERGRVVPNFARREFRKDAPPVSKEPLVFAAGRMWDEAKNLEALRNIAADLAWPVRIAGEGGDLGFLEAVELRRWYQRAAIYAWPAKYEPFGLSVLEAAAHSCALVLGDIPSLRENWDGAAIFVRSKTELGMALQSLIVNRELRDKMSQKASERSRRFRPELTVNAYREAYREVLAGVLCAS